jgi:hypothetical protein
MVSMRAARATASPKKSPSSCSRSPRVMTMRIARRSSPLFNCVRRNSSCIAIAASAAAVTLGKVIQNPSPWALTIRPSFPSARRQTNSRCSVSNADRSACGRLRNRGVEPLMSVFRIAVTRKVGIAGTTWSEPKTLPPFAFSVPLQSGDVSGLLTAKSTREGEASVV